MIQIIIFIKLLNKSIDKSICVYYNQNVQSAVQIIIIFNEVFNMIANNFSKILGEKRMKISDVSRETGISRSTLTAIYYQNNKAISFEVLNKLCDLFNCSVGELIYNDLTTEQGA